MNFILVGLTVSFALAGLSFLASENPIISISIFLLTNLFFVFVVKRRIDKAHLKIHRYHQCFQFINNFVISLNIKGSLNAAMQSGYETANEATKEIIDSIKEMNEEEKLTYLTKYFRFDLYHLFVDTIILWNEEGGDILKMSRFLVEQIRLKEEYLLTCQSIHKTKTIEFAILWSIALSILVVLRFALSQFFSYILHTIIYQVSIVVIMLFFLLSIYLLVSRVTYLELEGWKDEEK